MSIAAADVTRPAPGRLRLAVDIDRVDDKAARTVETLAADLRTYGADGQITPDEGVKIVGDLIQVLAPASLADLFQQVEPAVSAAAKDGKVTRGEAIRIGLALALAVTAG